MSLLQTFKNSSFVRNSLTLIFGTALAQLIPILLQPILRRSYSPEEFGFISIYITIVGMFAAIANFKYESAIVIPKEKKEADHLVLIGLFLSFVVSSILFIGMILFQDTWSSLLKIEETNFEIEMMKTCAYRTDIQSILNDINSKNLAKFMDK